MRDELSLRFRGVGLETEAGQPPANPEALANIREGVPERFVPGIIAGGLIEVEHLSRYHWAAQFAPGRRVLDVACGAGYGCALLAEAGAASVVGVDRSEGLIEAIAPGMPDGVELQVGDIRSLALPDAAFDLIVCFETIEHVEDPRAALTELARVLSPDGLMVVSTPERRLTGGDNPHHLHELTREELESELAERFASVQLFREEAFLSSAIIPDSGFTQAVGDATTVRKLTSVEPGLAAYVIGMASRTELPAARPFLGVTTRMDVITWQKYLDGAAAHAEHQQQRIDELNARLVDHAALQDRLLEVEQKLLEHGSSGHLDAELREQEEEREDEVRVLRERVERADRVWRDVQASPSWRLTRPLRALKSLLTGPQRP